MAGRARSHALSATTLEVSAGDGSGMNCLQLHRSTDLQKGNIVSTPPMGPTLAVGAIVAYRLDPDDGRARARARIQDAAAVRSLIPGRG